MTKVRFKDAAAEIAVRAQADRHEIEMGRLVKGQLSILRDRLAQMEFDQNELKKKQKKERAQLLVRLGYPEAPWMQLKYRGK